MRLYYLPIKRIHIYKFYMNKNKYTFYKNKNIINLYCKKHFLPPLNSFLFSSTLSIFPWTATCENAYIIKRIGDLVSRKKKHSFDFPMTSHMWECLHYQKNWRFSLQEKKHVIYLYSFQFSMANHMWACLHCHGSWRFTLHERKRPQGEVEPTLP